MDQLFESIEFYLEKYHNVIKFGFILLIVFFVVILFSIALALLTISLAHCFHFAVLLGAFILSGIIPMIWDYFRTKKRKHFDKFPVIRNFFKRFRGICFFIIIVSLLFYIFSDNTKVVANDIVLHYYPPFVVELGDDVKSLVSGLSDKAENENSQAFVEQNEIKEETNYKAINFKILNPDSKFNSEQFIETFFFAYESAIESDRLGSFLKINIYDLFSTKDSSAKYNCDTELDRIAQLETDFSNQIKLASLYIKSDVIKWYDMLPTSDDLDRIISLREKLVSEGYKCYTIFNRLSNDYQEYALEFYYLNENPNAILYYYCKSIEADMRALTYATNKREKNTCLQRIQIRYQDINSCEIIDESIREIAKAISIQIANDFGFDSSSLS